LIIIIIIQSINKLQKEWYLNIFKKKLKSMIILFKVNYINETDIFLSFFFIKLTKEEEEAKKMLIKVINLKQKMMKKGSETTK
jgi:hypothetical protein